MDVDLVDDDEKGCYDDNSIYRYKLKVRNLSDDET